MAVRLFVCWGSLWEVGGYGRLWLWKAGGYGGRLIALIWPIKPIIPLNPIKPHKSFRLFKPLLKTETAIRDLGWLFALVCYEKFERTLKLHSFGCCFTKHDLYRESIEIIFFRCLGPCLSGFVFALSGLYLMTVVALSTGDVVSMVRCCSVSMVAESV